MRQLWIGLLLVSLLGLAGAVMAASGTTPLNSNGMTTFDVPTPACTPTFETGDYPYEGGRRFVQTVNANSQPPYYYGPFSNRNPCQKDSFYFGFDHLGWYDNDFGWRHTFPPLIPNRTQDEASVNGVPCLGSATLYICAWDVDELCSFDPPPQRPTSLCEHDLVFGDGEALTPIQLSGSNYSWYTTAFNVPLELIEDGQLEVWLNIDFPSQMCNWATMVHQSQLVIDYRQNLPPYQPIGESTTCVSPDSNMCVLILGPTPADPDLDPVSYSFDWFLYTAAAGWQPIDNATPCLAAANFQVGDSIKVEVTAEDDCGLVSPPWVVAFKIVPTCEQNPVVGYDYGDLNPNCYPTSTNGPANPIHENNIAWLGSEITIDTIPRVINNDGADDGVEFIRETENTSWVPCEEVCVDVTIVTGREVPENVSLWLYGWKDGNLNCSFLDTLCDGSAPEAIIPGVEVTPGTHRFCFPDPGEMIGQGRYDGVFRFRLLSEHLSLDSALVSIDPLLGETEDYIITDLQLPVELLGFDVIQDGHSALLQWATASENNSDYFMVERKNGGAWQRIANVSAAGHSATRTGYQYRDESVELGQAYTYRLIAVDVNGATQELATADVNMLESDPGVITEFRLYANYPNPFNPTTTISFDLKEATYVTLTVYDVMGREVKTLADGNMNAGRYHLVFDAAGLPSGLYVYRITTPGFTDMRKMILLK